MPVALSSPLPGVARSAAGLWQWWVGELRAALPHALRPSATSRPRADIFLGPGGIVVERFAGGHGERFAEERQLADLDEEGWAELAGLIAGSRARILLATPDVYWTRVELPAAARRRLRAAVALQLPNVAPVKPEELVWQAEEAEGGPGRVRALVAMARAQLIEALAQRFEERGLAVPEIAALADDRTVTLRPAGREPGAAGSFIERRARPIAILLLASIPFTTIASASFLASLTESRIESLRLELAPRLAAEREAARTDQARRALRQVFAQAPASDDIENIALALPESDHALGTSRGPDGGLRLTVETASQEALEERLSENARLASAEIVDLQPAGAAGRMRVSLRRGAP
jgi:hypothetical protein